MNQQKHQLTVQQNSYTHALSTCYMNGLLRQQHVRFYSPLSASSSSVTYKYMKKESIRNLGKKLCSEHSYRKEQSSCKLRCWNATKIWYRAQFNAAIAMSYCFCSPCCQIKYNRYKITQLSQTGIHERLRYQNQGNDLKMKKMNQELRISYISDKIIFLVGQSRQIAPNQLVIT